ncbi:MAG TPA: hypothetical protein VFW53_09400 [Gallionella sp.]|nr:hypothetical protein [Gallionella sp.]
MQPIGAEFGFRTAYEITRFVYYHGKLAGTDWQFSDALDVQVLQKLMPKLSARSAGWSLLKALEGKDGRILASVGGSPRWVSRCSTHLRLLMPALFVIQTKATFRLRRRKTDSQWISL